MTQPNSKPAWVEELEKKFKFTPEQRRPWKKRTKIRKKAKK